MPELDGAWGYPGALGAVLPLLWFKRRGWR
jgi:hypothetical protein